MAQNQKKLEGFRTILKPEIQLYKIYVAQVDPDALAAAFAMQYILESEDKQAMIVYAGDISHPQNLFINNKYNLKGRMVHISEDKKTSKKYAVILVDSSLKEDSRLPGMKNFNPMIVVDHHRGSDIIENEDTFIWVEEVGASATLIWELLSSLKIKLPEDDKMLATLLALGIYSDTKGLLSAGHRDRTAFNEILKLIDQTELNSLIDYPLPMTYFNNLNYALKTMKTNGGRLVTGVSHIKSDQGDDISTVADELLRVTGVVMVVVWGIIDNRVRLSARASDPSINLNDFLKDRFEGQGGAKMTPDGRSEGGAMLDLELSFWLTHMPDKSRNKIGVIVQETIEHVVFKD